MACHNAAPYVEQAIASVSNQTFSDLELIIVDDASQDESLLLIRKAAFDDPRIKVLSLTNKVGAGAARNMAIEEARGEWLAILDADDVFFPNKLQLQFEIIKKSNLNMVLVGAGCLHIDAAGRIGEKYEYPAQSKGLKQNLLRGKKFPPHSSIIYRASVVNKIGGFNEKFLRAQDYELWLRLSEIGDFACCRLPLIKYRIHSRNISNQVSSQGFTQTEYGTAARVCQMLRHSGRIDPSTVDNQKLWDALLTHVTEVAQQSDHKNYEEWKRDWKLAWLNSHNLFDKLMCGSGSVARSPSFFIHLLREQTSGTGLAEKCFKSWNADALCVD